MEFRHIHYFIKIAECESISQAAAELFISQQALSKSVKNLEKAFGTRLFHRSNQGIKLTEDGRYLLGKFKYIYDSYSEALSETYHHFQIRMGKIEMGVSPGFFRSISTSYLIDFMKEHPGIEIDQVEYPDLDVEDYVLEDEQHFALSTKPWYQRGLVYRPLHREKLFFIAHKNHPLAREHTIHMDTLKSDGFLFFTDRYNISHRTIASCKKAGFTPKVVYKSTDVSQLVKMVNQQQGILICVEHVYEESAHDNLVCIPIDDEEMYWELGILFQNFEKLNENAKMFLNYFISLFKMKGQ